MTGRSLRRARCIVWTCAGCVSVEAEYRSVPKPNVPSWTARTSTFLKENVAPSV